MIFSLYFFDLKLYYFYAKNEKKVNTIKYTKDKTVCLINVFCIRVPSSLLGKHMLIYVVLIIVILDIQRN